MSEPVRHPDGVAVVDTHYLRPRLAAAHLLVHGGRAAIIDTGTSHAAPRILAALAGLGIAPAAVDWLFLTHVHLDHAGGAGQLLRALPNARAVLHPRGAPHLIDPSRLIASSIEVYGSERYAQLYGEILPLDPARVLVTADGQRLELAGRAFEFLHTPGHALHHQAILDHGSRSVFTGDAFGMAYPEFTIDGRAFIVPTTTPTQFDPQQMLASIERIAALQPQALYLTHYGRVTDVPRLATALANQVREFVRIAEAQAGAAAAPAAIRDGLRALWIDLARAHGCAAPERMVDELLRSDVELNTDGLVAWLARRKPRTG